MAQKGKYISYYVQYAILSVFLFITRLLPFQMRVHIGSYIIGALIPNLKEPRARIIRNLALIFPEMPENTRKKIAKQVGHNVGATLMEILNNDHFAHQQQHFHATGPGLAALFEAQKQGKGAILVSGHFGSWDSTRQYLKANGIEVAAVYRRNNNPYYDRLHLKMITLGGAPIFPTGRRGTMQMVKHLRDGGVVAILHDQKQASGEVLDFLGQPAHTSLGAAQLALKYDIPMIPFYGTRRTGAPDIDITFEAPIAQSDAKTMMQRANDSLSAMVLKYPGQWYWLHLRWK